MYTFCVFISFPSIALQMKYFTTLLFCNLFLIPLGMSSVLLSLSAYHSFKLFSFIVFPCSVQFSSVTQSCPTLCDPMNRSTPALPVHHQLPEFTQSHPWSQWCYSHPKTLIDISRKNIYPQIGTLWSSQADI